MNLALIPARGGSKRIPGKNVKRFHGRPIIAWPITTAIESGLFDRVVVSTDSEEIAAVAREWGADTPFVRPAELADDHTPTAPVLRHALERLAEEGAAYERCCLIYPTAVFVRAADLRAGFEILEERGVSAVVPVASFPAPIHRAFSMDESGRLAMIRPEHELTRSNDLPQAYHDAGQFYWLDCARFLENGRLYAGDAVGLLMPRHRVVDIDTPEDWRLAELLFRALKAEGEA